MFVTNPLEKGGKIDENSCYLENSISSGMLPYIFFKCEIRLNLTELLASKIGDMLKKRIKKREGVWEPNDHFSNTKDIFIS